MERSILMDIKGNFNANTNTWEVFFSGEIDIYNAPELKQKLNELIQQKQGNIIIDCKDLNYMDSTGLGVLISVLKQVKKYDGEIKIINLKPYIRKIFTITGLDKIFSIEVE